PMRPTLSTIAEHSLRNHHVLSPFVLVVAGTAVAIHTPVRHSLFATAASWALIWIFAVSRKGLRRGASLSTTCSLAVFLALGRICDRVICDKEGAWATKGLLPIVAVLVAENRLLPTRFALLSSSPDSDKDDLDGPTEKQTTIATYRILVVASVCALAGLANRFTTSSTLVLGLCSVLFTAIGWTLLENASKAANENVEARRGLVFANGTLSQPNPHGVEKDYLLALVRDVALAMTFLCGTASYFVEPSIFFHGSPWQTTSQSLLNYSVVGTCVLVVLTLTLSNILTFSMISSQGTLHTSFVVVFADLCARLLSGPSFSGVLFTATYVSAFLLFLYVSPGSSAVDVRTVTLLRRVFYAASALSISLLLSFMVGPGRSRSVLPFTSPRYLSGAALAPVHLDLILGHPAAQLIQAAEDDYRHVYSRQSQSLDEATKEYRRRNGLQPPPHFDKWYEYAVRNGVELIDEFDTISRALLPFWALRPSTIRERVRLALGDKENAFIGVMIRDGKIVKIENGDEWQQQATAGMMKDFVQYLPDMDLAFNIHDEPRVIVPHDELSVLVEAAHREIKEAAALKQVLHNSFSSRPSDLNDGKWFDIATTSRFNRYAHQQTWIPSRLSCPMASQARQYEPNAPDNLTAYAAEPLNYIYNQTAFSDICNSPSLSSTFGFFERPNAFSITHELTPIFSQSKISSYQDILYPSPWYWAGKVQYDEKQDTTWENKTNSLYWRGSTTGGFSRNGGWRRQHRQRIVRTLNAPDKAQIIALKESGYEVQEVERQDFDKLIDVRFSHIGQCDEGDCKAQETFFRVTEHAGLQDAWYHKHLLDMDGNAFSGRFYAFLKSRSLTYKMAVFREWHEDRLWPWIHYIPLSLNGTEHLDLVHWFAGGDSQQSTGEESLGERKAREIAERSTEWAGKALRNVDFEAWLFRLLLEYGRVVDDDRMAIGYPGP
ncbi:glycosyltransferase family 90 protein, partial [Sporormia fimetaria CBS 119925]